jgi:MSHA biogenesis protein MshL
MKPSYLVCLLLLFLPGSLLAATEPSAPAPEQAAPEAAGMLPLEEALAQPAQPMTFEKASLATVLYTLGKAYHFNVIVDPRVTGTTLLRFNGGTLRQLVDSLLESNDLYSETRDNFLYVRKTKTEFYFLEYPQISRSTTSSSSVSLSPTQQGGTGTTPGLTLNTGLASPAPGQGQALAQDNTQFQITEKNEDTFWSGVESDLKGQLQPDEKLVLNKFSGIAAIETSRQRHTFWRDYLRLLNQRITAQVLVEVRIDELTLDDAHKLGVDWTQVKTSLGGSNTVGPITVATNLAGVPAATLPGDTLLGNFSVGRLSAVFHALQQQGNLRTITKPSIRLLNNQKGYVKVGEDRTFWSLASNVTVNTGTANGSTISQTTYSGQRQTFGVVLPVTAQISQDGWVTLVIEPARTQLNAIDSSPDGKQNSPVTGDQRISTMLRLRDNQSAILGGLNSEHTARQTRRIPLLGDLPYVGRLARTEAETKQTGELLVTVSVKIIQ